MSSYDYVIVGAGSSGSALAGRLATNNNTKILLLEAGPKDYNPILNCRSDTASYSTTNP